MTFSSRPSSDNSYSNHMFLAFILTFHFGLWVTAFIRSSVYFGLNSTCYFEYRLSSMSMWLTDIFAPWSAVSSYIKSSFVQHVQLVWGELIARDRKIKGHIDLEGSKKPFHSGTKQPLAYIYQAPPSGTAETRISCYRSHLYLNFNKTTRVKHPTDRHSSIADSQRDWNTKIKYQIVNKIGAI